jgi:HPt (histidine-containing phosphotransfer) domain-containing protein
MVLKALDLDSFAAPSRRWRGGGGGRVYHSLAAAGAGSRQIRGAIADKGERDMGGSIVAERGARPPQPGAAAPVDLVFLARQTFGSRAVEQEVLRLFRDQAPRLTAAAAAARGEERARLAHRLGGAARAIGAGAVAEAARAVETEPEDAPLAPLQAAVAAALDFIARLDENARAG